MSEGRGGPFPSPARFSSWLRRSARRVLTGASVVMKKGRNAVARHTRWKLLLSALRSTQQSRASGRDLLRPLFNFKSRPHRCGIVIPNCSKYPVTWATVAIKPRSCTLCVSRSFWLARVTRSLVTRAMPSCSLLGTASKSAPRSNQRNQKNFIRVGFSTSGLLDTSGTLAGAR